MKHVLFCALLLMSIALPLPTFAKEFDIDQLLKILNSKETSLKIKSVEDFLAILPEDYRSNYVIMYASESSQPATPARPRVIFYGNDARLAIAFNGDPNLPGYNKIEVIATHPKSGLSTFYEVKFNEQPKIVKNSGIPSFTITKSPTQCSNCHSPRLHPNWQTYQNWRGAIGTTHQVPKISQFERQLLSKFISSVRKDPEMKRYRTLTSLNKLTVDKFSNRNKDLTNLLTELNAKRIFSEIADAATQHPEYQAAILSALSHDDQFLNYMPAGDKNELEKQFEEILSDTSSRITKSSDENVRIIIEQSKYEGLKVGDFFNQDHYEKDLYTAARLRFILETHLGIDMTHWPLTIDAGSYRFIDGKLGTFDPILKAYREFLETQPLWRSFFQKIEKGILMDTVIKRKLKDTFSPGACATRQIQMLMQ